MEDENKGPIRLMMELQEYRFAVSHIYLACETDRKTFAGDVINLLRDPTHRGSEDWKRWQLSWVSKTLVEAVDAWVKAPDVWAFYERAHIAECLPGDLRQKYEEAAARARFWSAPTNAVHQLANDLGPA